MCLTLQKLLLTGRFTALIILSFPLINDLKGIRNILKSGGILVLICEEYQSKNKALRQISEEHAKMLNIPIHTPEEFRDFFKKAGFSETKMFEDQEHSWITVIGKN